jgi:hypothetical protein
MEEPPSDADLIQWTTTADFTAKAMTDRGGEGGNDLAGAACATELHTNGVMIAAQSPKTFATRSTGNAGGFCMVNPYGLRYFRNRYELRCRVHAHGQGILRAGCLEYGEAEKIWAF